MSEAASDPYGSLDLLPQHAALLRASAISPEVAKARGYRSDTVKADLKRLGFSQSQQLVPALALPVWQLGREIAFHQIRPDDPRLRDGKKVKYETPPKVRMVLDVSPTVRHLLADPSVPLWITEGIRKGDALASLGLCAIALLGVWNWRGKNAKGGSAALADWDGVALKAADGAPRSVYLCFDSDVIQKPEVRQALARLKEFLESRGAEVLVVLLPGGDGGAKVGVDDFIAAGHDANDLYALAVRELPGGTIPDEPEAPYLATEAGIFWNKPTQHGPVLTQLTNFNATIDADVVRDDGVERTHLFEIAAKLGERRFVFTIPAREFVGMNWPLVHMGPAARIDPTFASDRRVRDAIQCLSGSPPEKTVYAHTGWRKIDDTWVYLHGGGAIGPIGPISGVDVQLPGDLTRYVLPPPPQGEERVAAIRASLRVLRVASARITVPVLAEVYRAVLGTGDFSVHLTGATGAGKSEIAALAAQHYGPGLDSRNLNSWSSTGNALEGLSFFLKDALFVVDDFAPGGTINDVARLQRDASRFLRAQGNLSGRSRMGPDGSLRVTRAPRGLTLSSGEDIPKDHSIRARMLGLEVSEGDVNWALVDELQPLAATGILAQSLAAFIQCVAAKHDKVLALARERVRALRAEAHKSDRHRRIATTIAELGAGLQAFLDIAVECEAVTRAEADEIWRRGWGALGDAAARHSGTVAQADPVVRFRELVCSAVASGEAHVAGEDGCDPDSPAAWGWREHTFGAGDKTRTEWLPEGKRIGWVVGDDLYLDAGAALKAAQVAAGPSADGIAIGVKTLSKRLQERGFLVSVEDARGHLTVRRMLEDRRRPVLHLRADFLSPPAESAQSAHRGENPDAKPPDRGPIPDSGDAQKGESAHGEAAPGAESAGCGPIGPISGGNTSGGGGRADAHPAATGPSLHDMAPEEFKKDGPPKPTPLLDDRPEGAGGQTEVIL